MFKLIFFLISIVTCYNAYYDIQYSELIQNLSLEASQQKRKDIYEENVKKSVTNKFLSFVSESLFTSRRIDFMKSISVTNEILSNVNTDKVIQHLKEKHGFPEDTTVEFSPCNIGQSDPICMDIVVNGVTITN